MLNHPNISYTTAMLKIQDSDLEPQLPTEAMATPEEVDPAACAIPSQYATVSTISGTADLSMSIALHPPAFTCINRRLPGQPTASHQLEPGPFHRANATLRHQFPLHSAEVHTFVRWDHVAVFVLCGLGMCAYIATRVYYLATGQSSDFELISGQNVALGWSWVALLAEALSAMSALYANPMFWKQIVELSSIPEEDVEDMATVRSGHSGLTNVW